MSWNLGESSWVTQTKLISLNRHKIWEWDCVPEKRVIRWITEWISSKSNLLEREKITLKEIGIRTLVKEETWNHWRSVLVSIPALERNGWERSWNLKTKWVFFWRDYLRRIGPSPNKVLPSSLADWHQKEEIIKLGECDLQGGDGDTSRPAAAPNVRRGAGWTRFEIVGEWYFGEYVWCGCRPRAGVLAIWRRGRWCGERTRILIGNETLAIENHGLNGKTIG
jgi:hypothetical protein